MSLPLPRMDGIAQTATALAAITAATVHGLAAAMIAETTVAGVDCLENVIRGVLGCPLVIDGILLMLDVHEALLQLLLNLGLFSIGIGELAVLCHQ